MVRLLDGRGTFSPEWLDAPKSVRLRYTNGLYYRPCWVRSEFAQDNLVYLSPWVTIHFLLECLPLILSNSIHRWFFLAYPQISCSSFLVFPELILLTLATLRLTCRYGLRRSAVFSYHQYAGSLFPRRFTFWVTMFIMFSTLASESPPPRRLQHCFSISSKPVSPYLISPCSILWVYTKSV